jgi:ferrochelatase
LALEVGMRYGNPSIDLALKKLQHKGCEKIVVLPLYPQYSDTTTHSTLDAVNKALDSWENTPEMVFIDNYYRLSEQLNCVNTVVVINIAIVNEPLRYTVK